MQSILDYLSAVWLFKLSVLPVLTTYFIFDLPAIIRRLTRRAYIPIYFMFFPLGHSDEMYARYFNDDDMYGVGASMTPEQKEALRTHIQVTAVLSMVFAAVVAPWVCGLLAAFYLSSSEFLEFLWFLAIIKSILLCVSLREIHCNDTFITRTNSLGYVAGVYLLYLLLILTGVSKSYWWTVDRIAINGLLGVLGGLAEFAYTEVFINVVVVAMGTWAITNRYLDPAQIREVAGHEDAEDRKATSPPA